MTMFTRLVISRQQLSMTTLGGNAFVRAAMLWHRSAIRFRGAIYRETHVET